MPLFSLCMVQWNWENHLITTRTRFINKTWTEFFYFSLLQWKHLQLLLHHLWNETVSSAFFSLRNYYCIFAFKVDNLMNPSFWLSLIAYHIPTCEKMSENNTIFWYFPITSASDCYRLLKLPLSFILHCYNHNHPAFLICIYIKLPGTTKAKASLYIFKINLQSIFKISSHFFCSLELKPCNSHLLSLWRT